MHRRLALGFLLLAACHAAGGASESSAAVNAASAAPMTIADASYHAVTGEDDFAPTFAFSGNGRAVVQHVNQADNLVFDAFLDDGTFDQAMGKNGRVRLQLPGTTPGNATAISASLTMEDDGSVLAWGQHLTDAGTTPFAARIVNGALDSTFGNAGLIALSDATQTLDAVAAIHLTKGKLGGYYAVLSRTDASSLYHFDSAGTLDATFGGTTDGKVVLPSGHYAIAVDSTLRPTLLDSVHCQALRFTAAGVADTTFGANGLVGSTDTATTLGFVADGRMLVGNVPEGKLDAGTGRTWTLERLLAKPEAVTVAAPVVAATADGGAKKPTTSESVPVQESTQDPEEEEQPTQQATLPTTPPTSKMTQEPTVGCTASPGSSGSREVPFLALILAVALLARRRTS